MAICIAAGIALGTTVGIVQDNIGMGIGVGLALAIAMSFTQKK